jgi:DNA-binding transcriptional ArsR family regulator
MRREELYLTDILEAADAIQRFIQGIEREDFFGDELHQSAVLQKLIVIGEAAARLPEEFIKRHPKVEWADIPQHRRARVFCRSEKGRFEVIFYQDPYTGERLREMGLNERQVKAVLYVKDRGSITNGEFRELTGLSDEAARKDLAELTEKELLRVEGKGRSTRYVFPNPGD